MADLDLYEEEEELEEEAAAAEGTNRTFKILVGIMAGIIVLSGLCGGVYVLWWGPKMAADRAAQNHVIELTNEAIRLTNEAIMAAAAVTGTVPGEMPTSTPTFTPVPPTNTPEPTSTYTPTPQVVAEVMETPTAEPAKAQQASPTLTPTRRVTPTPRVSPQKEKVPGTGIGAFETGLIALGLVFLLVVVRRLRQS